MAATLFTSLPQEIHDAITTHLFAPTSLDVSINNPPAADPLGNALTTTRPGAILVVSKPVHATMLASYWATTTIITDPTTLQFLLAHQPPLDAPLRSQPPRPPGPHLPPCQQDPAARAVPDDPSAHRQHALPRPDAVPARGADPRHRLRPAPAHADDLDRGLGAVDARDVPLDGSRTWQYKTGDTMAA